ncbi:hypothetical protein EBT31_03540 [bacterium]|nr:hypothetical protein [bacterium]NBX48694.1 hypothetical protein [bacterium]
MDAEGRIIELAFSFDGWVFGGYVRDTVIRKEKAADIDICFPYTSSVDTFLRVLAASHELDIFHDKEHPEGLYMSKGIRRLVKVIVDGDIHLDVCEYRGTFENWRREKSTDFTCNLFYMSSDTALGIRYIPDDYKHVPNPCRHLINMTKRKEFARIWGKDHPTLKNTRTILSRMQTRVRRGWYLVNDTVCSEMAAAMEEDETRAVWDRVNDIDHLCDKLQAEATGLPKDITDTLADIAQ